MDTCIKELMSTEMVSIPPDAFLADAINSMVEHRYSCQIVVENGLPIGIITERDIVRLMSRFFSDKPERPVIVRDVMSKPVTTVTEATILFEALVISAAEKIRHLPVVDAAGRLQGLVTQVDLARAHVRLIEEQREILERDINCRDCELQQANEKLKALSMIDALMGIGNRRAMEVDLEHTHALTLRYKRSYATLIFDVDYFKNYNDTYGHMAGDEALRMVSEYLQTCIRKSDRLYRFGGEEILMLLPETTQQGAMILADRIVAGLAELQLPHASSPLGIITMSCGVACQSHQPGHASWQDLVHLADQGLYSAKRNGRNRAQLAEEDTVALRKAPQLLSRPPLMTC
jgi:diguanylate cyclase (GGDEF)-like protein